MTPMCERGMQFRGNCNLGFCCVLWAGVLLAWPVLSVVALAADADSATQAVKVTIDQVMQLLANDDLKSPERAEEKRTLLKQVIGERFDYEEMGKRTLGFHWRKLNDTQQKEFVLLFQDFLSNTYASNVDGYSGEQVEYLKERRKGDFAEVQTKVISPKIVIPLNYRLLKKSGNWMVYDVVIDGVSLVKNFRGQFARIIKGDSFQGLLDKLREKTSN